MAHTFWYPLRGFLTIGKEASLESTVPSAHIKLNLATTNKSIREFNSEDEVLAQPC